MAGLLGAGLAALTGRRLGRVGLAVACGAAGFAYGALLDLSVMVSYGGEQSLDRYLALSARGLPFNIAHAAGNVAFALIAGPGAGADADPLPHPLRVRVGQARGRAGRRGVAAGRDRCVVGGRRDGLPASGAGRRDGRRRRLSPRGPERRRRLRLLARRRLEPGMTGWATLGLEAAGVDPLTLRAGARRRSPTCARPRVRSTTPRDLERTILVVDAAGLNPRRFAGRDLVSEAAGAARLERLLGGPGRTRPPSACSRWPRSGSGGADRSASWLVRDRNQDGGWGFAPGTNSDADTTGAVLQALAAAEAGRGAINGGVRYLRSAQRAGGGFPLPGGGANAQSTAWAIQGLIAAGVSPASCAGAAATRSTTSPRCRRPTATTATRAPATRRPSGSRPRRCRPPSEPRSRSPRSAAAMPAERGVRARAAPAPRPVHRRVEAARRAAPAAASGGAGRDRGRHRRCGRDRPRGAGRGADPLRERRGRRHGAAGAGVVLGLVVIVACGAG